MDRFRILWPYAPDDDPPEGTEVGGDGEPIPPGEENPYPSGG